MKEHIYSSLWAHMNGLEMAQYYTELFPHSRITSSNSTVVEFELQNQKFQCINGGPEFPINPSISLFTHCKTREEVDTVWKTMLEGGTVLMELGTYPWSEHYGWIQDRFGLTWQLSFDPNYDNSQHIIPLLMFVGDNAGKAWEAVERYNRIFPQSSIDQLTRYEQSDGDNPKYLKHAQCTLNGYRIMAMDSSLNHKFNFNAGVSLVVECDDQEEIDYFWRELLVDGGKEQQCGWLSDAYGVNWQIIPAQLRTLMRDPERAPRVMKSLLTMIKIDLNTLINA